MGLYDGIVRKTSDLVGITAPDRKAAAGSLPVVVSTEDKAVFDAMQVSLDALSPSVRQDFKLAIYSGRMDGIEVWEAPDAVPAEGARITDILFSTSVVNALMLHEASKAEYLAQCITDGALHFWWLDDDSSTAADSGSTGGITLASTATPTFAQLSPLPGGRSVYFDGVDDGLKSSSKPASSGVGAIEFWAMLPELPSASQHVFVGAADDATDSNYIRIGASQTPKLTIWMVIGGAPTLNLVSGAGRPLTVNQWQHYVITQPGGGVGINFYLDGVNLNFTGTGLTDDAWWGDIHSVADNLSVGYSARSSAGEFQKANIAGVAWYNNEVTEAEALVHYNMGVPIFGPDYYAANGGAAATLKAPIEVTDATAVHATTTGTGNATVQLLGYEEA